MSGDESGRYIKNGDFSECHIEHTCIRREENNERCSPIRRMCERPLGQISNIISTECQEMSAKQHIRESWITSKSYVVLDDIVLVAI